MYYILYRQREQEPKTRGHKMSHGKNIIIEINEKTIKGYWNGKTYSSTENDHRVYIENKEYHISNDKYNELVNTEEKKETKHSNGGEVEITISGKKVSGYWNGKSYFSVSNDYRVYIAEKEYHISESELSEMMNPKKEEKAEVTNTVETKKENVKSEKRIAAEKEIAEIRKEMKSAARDEDLRVLSNVIRKIKLDAGAKRCRTCKVVCWPEELLGGRCSGCNVEYGF